MCEKVRKWWGGGGNDKNENTEEENLQGEQSTITDERQCSLLEETSNTEVIQLIWEAESRRFVSENYKKVHPGVIN